MTTRPEATTSPEDLLTWASQRVGEPAARPKSIIVLDSLPVTAVGKPYKVPLRLDATRRAAEQALVGVPGVSGVEVNADNGVTVTVAAQADRAAIAEILNRFAFQWNLT